MKVVDCPKCKGAAVDITPLKKKDERIAVYGCQACGFAFTADGKAFVKDGEALQDVFRGATQGNQALVDMLIGTGEHINPTTRALLAARMLEYGVTMWMDGLKQGILLGVIQNDYVKRGSPTTEVGRADGKQPGGEMPRTEGSASASAQGHRRSGASPSPTGGA